MGRLAIEVKVSGHGRRVVVYVLEARSSVVAEFDFVAGSRKEPLHLVGLRLQAKAQVGEIRITDVRKTFPLGRWEAAARLAAAEELRALERTNQKPGRKRAVPKGRSAPPYEEVARRYRELTKAGVRHPSAVLAQEMGIPPTSAWNWLRRCRELGLLAPAPGQGIAGEVEERAPRRAARVVKGEGGRA